MNNEFSKMVIDNIPVVEHIKSLQSQLTANEIVIKRLREQLRESVSPATAEKWKQRYIGVVLAMSDPSDVDLEELSTELQCIDL